MPDPSRIIQVCFVSMLHILVNQESTLNKFPDNFLLGFASSSYQIEGGWNEDGKGESVWDRLTHSRPECFRGSATGDAAADSYHKYREDVAKLRDLGAQVYKFSLSWSRILPTGDPFYVNPHGIDYYNNLIDELLRNGIQPVVTLYHWDLPETLSKIGGWMNSLLVDYFQDYAKICFTHFGDRVKWWITINDPVDISLRKFERCSYPVDSLRGLTEYTSAHNLLTAHAMVYHTYDAVFRPIQQGKIGIALTSNYMTPTSECPIDAFAAEMRMQFEIGWFAHPILRGGYPPAMREIVDAKSAAEGRERSRLPCFNPRMLNFVLGTADFLGVNHYTTFAASMRAPCVGGEPSWDADTGVTLSQSPNWHSSSAMWLKVFPTGFRKILSWIKREYNNVPVFITGNGFADKGQIKDTERIYYHKEYILQMLRAVFLDGCNVIGYAASDLMDSFEWFEGYEIRYGVYHVNFSCPNRTRTPKASAAFFRRMYHERMVPTCLEKSSNRNLSCTFLKLSTISSMWVGDLLRAVGISYSESQ